MSIPDTITLILTDRSPDAKLVSVDPPEFAGLYSIRCGVIWGSWNPITVEGNLVCMKVLYQSDEKRKPVLSDDGYNVVCAECHKPLHYADDGTTWECECGYRHIGVNIEYGPAPEPSDAVGAIRDQLKRGEPEKPWWTCCTCGAPEKLTACGECARAYGLRACKSSRAIDDKSVFAHNVGCWFNERHHLNPDGHCEHFEAKV